MNERRARTLAVVQHVSAEHLGLIEDHFEGRGIRFRYFRPFVEGGRLPGSRDWADGLVLLGGGSWGATPGPHRLPTLDAEVAMTATALAAGGPILGIGLGAAILALAAGGTATPTPLEFAVEEARRTVEDALDGLLPDRLPMVRYGRDLARPPAAADVLAVDPRGDAAVFRCAPRAFGFRGHPGAKSAIVEDLIMDSEDAPENPQSALQALRTQQRSLEDSLVPIMTGLVRCMGLMG